MAKPKRVPYELIKREDVHLCGNPYELLDEIRSENHFETVQARIALAWKKGNKHDVDGHLTLGKCHKLTDLQREMCPFDFVIELNKEVWEDPEFTRAQKLALIDHEMCHAARAVDSEGSMQTDSLGRPVWRIRKHDIEEFRAIVERHGCYKRDLELFAREIVKKQKSPLLSSLPPAGVDSMTLICGDESVTITSQDLN